MPRKKALNGQGTVYKEKVDERRTRWVAEILVTLPNGLKKRVRVRARTAEEAVALRDARANAVRLTNPDAERMTVSDLSERWLAARSHALKPSTIATYRKSLNAYVLPAIGAVRVARVTPLDIQNLVNAILARAKPGGRNDMRAAADRARRVTSALFEQAVAWELITKNPVGLVPAVRPAERERGYWTRDEARAFLAAAEGEAYAPLFRAALETGLRLGELLALRWADCDGREFTVRRTFSSDTGAVQESPKSASGRRSVPVGPELAAAIGTRGPSAALVFPSRTGGVLSPSSVRRAFDRVQAKVPGLPRLKFHDMRRSYASLLAADGFHPSVIQKLLGHSSPDLAMRVYTSVSSDSMAEAVVRLGGSEWGNNGGGTAIPTGSNADNVRGRPRARRASGTRRSASGTRRRKGTGRVS